MWNLRGAFGVLDSERADVHYEDFKGHRLDRQIEPLVYHNAAITLNSHSVQLTFDQQKQTCLDALRFKDGSTIKEIPHGKGRIFWTAYPVELAEGTQPAADLYAYVAGRLGITPGFEFQSPVARGVLVYPIELQDSVLHVMVSDSSEDVKVDLRDTLTGARLTIPLASQHAALAVVGKQEKKVVAGYGF